MWEDLQPSFFKTSPYEEYMVLNPARVPGTCEWFVNHERFQRWKASERNDILWLSADPGCGKSVLSRALVDERLADDGSAIICYFFFKDNEKQNNASSAICALLHQLFCAKEQLLQNHAKKPVEQHGESLKSEFEALWRLWIAAATDESAGDVICILDALDECRQFDQERLIKKLDSFFSTSHKETGAESKLKFLVTSRPSQEIERQFRALTDNDPQIHVSSEMESEQIGREIAHVVDVEVDKIGRDIKDEDIKEALREKLLETPNRTYLWLRLTLDHIRKTLLPTKANLLKRIGELPTTVEEAYEKLLAKCDEQDARRVLNIIVAAQRPLTVSEINVALGIAESDEFEYPRPQSLSYASLNLPADETRKSYVRDSCGLFVSVVGIYVHLIHQTARNFLIGQNEMKESIGRWKHSINLRLAHQMVAKICVINLFFREARDPTHSNGSPVTSSSSVSAAECTGKYALLEYSASHWTTHFSEAGSTCEGSLTEHASELWRHKKWSIDDMVQSVHSPKQCPSRFVKK
jgi:hypothetical protein